MSVTQLIQENYPSLAFLVGHKEIGPLLRDAVDPNKGFSPQTFQAKLYQTNWWRRSSSTSREWLIKSQTDPGTANQDRASYRSALQASSFKYGAALTPAQLKWMSEVGLAKGWDPAGPEMTAQLRQLLEKGRANRSGVGRDTYGRQAQLVARGEYLLPMDKKNADKWGARIAGGQATLDDVRQQLLKRAIIQFPQYAAMLRQGYTMRELTDTQRQTIAEELEVDPETIDLTNGRWSKVLAVRDKGSKQVRPMTQHETLQLARQDPRFWKSSKGSQMDAQWSSTILGMFGKRSPMGAAS